MAKNKSRLSSNALENLSTDYEYHWDVFSITYPQRHPKAKRTRPVEEYIRNSAKILQLESFSGTDWELDVHGETNTILLTFVTYTTNISIAIHIRAEISTSRQSQQLQCSSLDCSRAKTIMSKLAEHCRVLVKLRKSSIWNPQWIISQGCDLLLQTYNIFHNSQPYETLLA